MVVNKRFQEFDKLYKYLNSQSKDLLIGLIYGMSRGNHKNVVIVARYIKRELRKTKNKTKSLRRN